MSTHLNPKDRKCGPSCTCKNTVQSQAQTCPDETDLLVTDLLEEDFEDVYVEESDDDLEELRVEEMDKDEELQSIMDFVFGPEIEDEDES